MTYWYSLGNIEVLRVTLRIIDSFQHVKNVWPTLHHWENSFRHCGKWLKACRIMQGKYRLSAEVCRSRIRSSYLMKCRNFRDADDNEHDDWELILRNLYWNADYRFASNRINYHRAKQLPRNVRANCSTKSFRWYRYICSKRWRRAT